MPEWPADIKRPELAGGKTGCALTEGSGVPLSTSVQSYYQRGCRGTYSLRSSHLCVPVFNRDRVLYFFAAPKDKLCGLPSEIKWLSTQQEDRCGRFWTIIDEETHQNAMGIQFCPTVLWVFLYQSIIAKVIAFWHFSCTYWPDSSEWPGGNLLSAPMAHLNVTFYISDSLISSQSALIHRTGTFPQPGNRGAVCFYSMVVSKA